MTVSTQKLIPLERKEKKDGKKFSTSEFSAAAIRMTK